MTGCALSRGSMASNFAAGGRFSHDCELIRLGGISKQLLSCLNRCSGEPRSGGMRRTRECMRELLQLCRHRNYSRIRGEFSSVQQPV